jgi:hypothetical protein
MGNTKANDKPPLGIGDQVNFAHPGEVQDYDGHVVDFGEPGFVVVEFDGPNLTAPRRFVLPVGKVEQLVSAKRREYRAGTAVVVRLGHEGGSFHGRVVEDFDPAKSSSVVVVLEPPADPSKPRHFVPEFVRPAPWHRHYTAGDPVEAYHAGEWTRGIVHRSFHPATDAVVSVEFPGRGHSIFGEFAPKCVRLAARYLVGQYVEFRRPRLGETYQVGQVAEDCGVFKADVRIVFGVPDRQGRTEDRFPLEMVRPAPWFFQLHPGQVVEVEAGGEKGRGVVQRYFDPLQHKTVRVQLDGGGSIADFSPLSVWPANNPRPPARPKDPDTIVVAVDPARAYSQKTTSQVVEAALSAVGEALENKQAEAQADPHADQARTVAEQQAERDRVEKIARATGPRRHSGFGWGDVVDYKLPGSSKRRGRVVGEVFPFVVVVPEGASEVDRIAAAVPSDLVELVRPASKDDLAAYRKAAGIPEGCGGPRHMMKIPAVQENTASPTPGDWAEVKFEPGTFLELKPGTVYTAPERFGGVKVAPRPGSWEALSSIFHDFVGAMRDGLPIGAETLYRGLLCGWMASAGLPAYRHLAGETMPHDGKPGRTGFGGILLDRPILAAFDITGQLVEGRLSWFYQPQPQAYSPAGLVVTFHARVAGPATLRDGGDEVTVTTSSIEGESYSHPIPKRKEV